MLLRCNTLLQLATPREPAANHTHFKRRHGRRYVPSWLPERKDQKMRLKITRIALIVTAVSTLAACTITPARYSAYPTYSHQPQIVVEAPYSPPPVVVVDRYPRPYVVITPAHRHHHYRGRGHRY